MSAAKSPTGKRLALPILARSLPRAANQSQDSRDELLEAVNGEIRRIMIALVLWIAFLAILYLYTVPWAN
jgi:hypothetical protein